MEWRKTLLTAAIIVGIVLVWAVVERPLARLRRWTAPRLNGWVVAGLWLGFPLAWLWVHVIDPHGAVAGTAGLAAAGVVMGLPLVALLLWYEPPPSPQPPREPARNRLLAAAIAAAALAVMPLVPGLAGLLTVAALPAVHVAIRGRIPVNWPAWIPLPEHPPADPPRPPRA